MLIIPDHQITKNLGYPGLIEALHAIFLSDYTMPLRHHHFYRTAEGEENTLILMPVWNDRYTGVKQVTVAPGNARRGLPSVFARYTLSDTVTGEPLAVMNAAEITARRTACTSALASSYLSRKDAEHLLIVGSGKVAQHLVQAHRVVRNFRRISIWARNPDKMNRMVEALALEGIQAETVENLETTAREADVISCATLSATPVIRGEWIKEGTHLDLIGSHQPHTRETDNDAIRKSRIFVDSRMGALHETGDLALPIAEGIISEKDVKAELAELIRGIHPGRENEQEITLFKSAGLAVEDLAAALLVYEKYREETI